MYTGLDPESVLVQPPKLSQSEKIRNYIIFALSIVSVCLIVWIICLYVFHSKKSTRTSNKPVVCIPGSKKPNSDDDYTNFRYVLALEKFGVVPLMLPMLPTYNEELIREQVSKCDGLLMQGGIDVSPDLYGEQPDPLLEYTNRDLDNFQIYAFKSARNMSKPVMGICRGMQIINVASGGSLYQDISRSPLPSGVERCTHRQTTNNNTEYYGVHTVELEKNTILASLFPSLSLFVNSVHHQSVKEVAPGFKVAAKAPDGIIESIEATTGSWVLAVQFHPEYMTVFDDTLLPVFNTFVEQVKKSASI